jgi:hypothetical protein
MGLIKELVLLPVAPLRGTIWVAEKVAEQVEEQEYSDAAGVQKLEEIAEARERGDLDEEEARKLEEQVLESQIARADTSGEVTDRA